MEMFTVPRIILIIILINENKSSPICSGEPWRRLIIVCTEFSDENLMTYKFGDYRSLTITNSTIKGINASIFANLTELEYLQISHTQMKKIVPGAFRKLISIRTLNLNNNQLERLETGILNCLVELENLDLSHNQISVVEDQSLSGLVNLGTLYLNDNLLRKFASDLFSSTINLRYLSLSKNPMTDLDNIYFPNQLENLEISNARLESVNSEINLTAIANFIVKKNSLKVVNFEIFLNALILDFSENEINFVESWDINRNLDKLNVSHNLLTVLNKPLSNEDKSISNLDVSYNLISQLDKDCFSNYKNLTNLHLQGNRLTKIPSAVFRNLTKLVQLDLSNNQIVEFDYGTFDDLKNLQILNISTNNLISLHQNSLLSLSSLRRFYFDNNQITTFSVEWLKRFLPNLILVSIDKNLWICKELVRNIWTLKQFDVYISPGNSHNVENYKGIACNNPEEYVPQNLSSNTDNSGEFIISVLGLVVQIIIALFLGIYLSVMFVVRYRNRRRVLNMLSQEELL